MRRPENPSDEIVEARIKWHVAQAGECLRVAENMRALGKTKEHARFQSLYFLKLKDARKCLTSPQRM